MNYLLAIYYYFQLLTTLMILKLNLLLIGKWKMSHLVKNARIRSYYGPHFPAFGLNMERYSVSLRIQSECGKIQTRITPNADTFYAMSFNLDWAKPAQEVIFSTLIVRATSQKHLRRNLGARLTFNNHINEKIVNKFRSATLLKRDSNTGVFLWILWNF